MKTELKKTKWYNDDVYELTLARNGLSFVPGDCVALFDAPLKESRPYSIASGTDEEVLRFVIRRMPGGKISEYMAALDPGADVDISPPFGWFRPAGKLAREADKAVYIATGTGIAPFLAALRSHPALEPHAMLWGVRKCSDAADLEWVSERCPLQLAVSREEVQNTHHGRVTDLLPPDHIDPARHYYLCGLDVMIDDMTVLLEQAAVPLEHIHRECFFNQSFQSA